MSIGVSTSFPTAAGCLAVELPETDGIYDSSGVGEIYMNLSGSDHLTSLYPIVRFGQASGKANFQPHTSQAIHCR